MSLGYLCVVWVVPRGASSLNFLLCRILKRGKKTMIDWLQMRFHCISHSISVHILSLLAFFPDDVYISFPSTRQCFDYSACASRWAVSRVICRMPNVLSVKENKGKSSIAIREKRLDLPHLRPIPIVFLSLSFVHAPNERSHISVENLRKSLRESYHRPLPTPVEPVIKESSTEVPSNGVTLDTWGNFRQKS